MGRGAEWIRTNTQMGSWFIQGKDFSCYATAPGPIPIFKRKISLLLYSTDILKDVRRFLFFFLSQQVVIRGCQSLGEGHDADAGHAVKIYLLDVLGLDTLLLAADEDLDRLVSTPAIFTHPHFQLTVIQVPEHL